MGKTFQGSGGEVGSAVGFTDFRGGADHGGGGDGVDLLVDGATKVVGKTHELILSKADLRG